MFSSLCTCAFILFRLRLLTEHIYLKIFNLIVNKIIEAEDELYWIHYQDYTKLSSKARHNIVFDICEIIIDSPVGASNRSSTLEALSLADKAVMPCTTMTLYSLHKENVIIPYGGDKASFSSSLFCNKKIYKKKHNLLKIAARANSERKGVIQFLESISILNAYLVNIKPKMTVEINICGSIDEQIPCRLFKDLQSLLIRNQSPIRLTQRRYSQTGYFNIIQQSDFFVMPSTRESSSLAALEALWMGVPCILTEACGIEQFQHCTHGLLLDSNDSRSIFAAIVRMIENPNELLGFRDNLANCQNLFSWASYIKGYKEILNSLC